MAGLIVKSPYIKGGGGRSAGGYLRYIATRERVEILPDGRLPTRKQEQLITKLTEDFPDTRTLVESSDYAERPGQRLGADHHGTGGTLGRSPRLRWLRQVHCHPAPGGAIGQPRSLW